MSSEVLAKVIRGDTVESIHRGNMVVIDGSGKTLLSVGDPDTVTYFRSSAKPLQALPFITSGAADAFGFSEEEIALVCASHSGESRHVRIAQLMLDRLGLNQDYLRCGAHLPFYEKEAERMQRANEYPTQLHNNCSGKHAAMLAVAKHIGADISEYESPESPVQKAILNAVAQFCEVSESDIAIGIDGCAAPNFAVTVRQMARSFINLLTPPEHFDEASKQAAKRIVSAMANNPVLVGGSERLDTLLVQAAEGRIISKVGADGVWLCGILPGNAFPAGAAIALKIEDGNDHRARPVVAVAILKHLGVLPPNALPDLSPMPLTNRRGDTVGKVESSFL